MGSEVYWDESSDMISSAHLRQRQRSVCSSLGGCEEHRKWAQFEGTNWRMKIVGVQIVQEVDGGRWISGKDRQTNSFEFQFLLSNNNNVVNDRIGVRSVCAFSELWLLSFTLKKSKKAIYKFLPVLEYKYLYFVSGSPIHPLLFRFWLHVQDVSNTRSSTVLMLI